MKWDIKLQIVSGETPAHPTVLMVQVSDQPDEAADQDPVVLYGSASEGEQESEAIQLPAPTECGQGFELDDAAELYWEADWMGWSWAPDASSNRSK